MLSKYEYSAAVGDEKGYQKMKNSSVVNFIIEKNEDFCL